MIEYLFQMNDIRLFAVLSSVFFFISIVFIIVVRSAIPLRLRYKDNATIIGTVSLISIIYGILAGITSLYLINTNTSASNIVLGEANSTGNVYRYSQWLKEPVRSTIRHNINDYISRVINIEWPQMRTGKIVDVNGGNYILDKIMDEIIKYSETTTAEKRAVDKLMDDIRLVYVDRQERIEMSYSELSPEIWEVILIGTFLTLFLNFLLGMNFYFHLLSSGAAALMCASMIFLLMTLDRPFQGEFAIDPGPFEAVVSYIKETTAKAEVNHKVEDVKR